MNSANTREYLLALSAGGEYTVGYRPSLSAHTTSRSRLTIVPAVQWIKLRGYIAKIWRYLIFNNTTTIRDKTNYVKEDIYALLIILFDKTGKR